MPLKRYLVIDTGPSSIALRVTGHRRATAPPMPPLRREVYPDPAHLQNAFDDLVKTVAVWLLIYFCLSIMWVHVGLLVYLSIRALPDSPWLAQFPTAVAAAITVELVFGLQQKNVERLHMDSDKGVIVAGRNRFELSHVCFFHAAEYSSQGLYGSTEQVRVIEIVSLFQSLVVAFWSDSSAVQEAIPHMDSFLQNWKQRTHLQSSLPCQAIQQFRSSCGSVQIKRGCTLLRARPKYCSLHFTDGERMSFSCYRFLPLGSFLKWLLRFFAFGTVMWVVTFIVALYRDSWLLDIIGIREVIIITLVWTIPLLVLLVLRFRREAWDMAASGSVRHRTGWACFSESHHYDVSSATTVTLDLAEAEAPETNGTKKIGGRRFGLSWHDEEGMQLFKVEKLFGGEAAFLAEKVRMLYPAMFVEGASAELQVDHLGDEQNRLT